MTGNRYEPEAHKQKNNLDLVSRLSLGGNSGGRIRTYDLRVMSPTSYQTALPRNQ